MPHPVHDVLVVVPGILGSCLARDGSPIWGGMATAAALVNPATLRLRGDGLAPEPDVQATGLIGSFAQFPGLLKIDAYDGLIDWIRKNFELDSGNFVIFSYDWRLSCSVNAKLLADRIRPVLKNRRLSYSNSAYVFVCHSMGGLVAQYFTDLLGGADDTKHVITLGAPFRGSVKALGVMSHGWPARLPGIRSRFRKLAQTLPSLYELLPRYRAVIDGPECRRLADEDLPPRTRSDLFEHSSALHDALDYSQPRPYGRTVIVGSLQRTPQFVQCHGGVVRILHQWEHNGTTVDERGDCTVPRQSVTPPEWRDDRQAIPFAQTHLGLPTAHTVFRVLRNVLTATPREEQFDERARLAIEVPDILDADTEIEIECEIAEGDRQVPLIVRIESLDRPRLPDVKSARERDGRLVAHFDPMPPGDYKVSVGPALNMPDVRSVWDVFSIIDSSFDLPVVD